MVEKIGRNAPCPCGSGKKFKKCHGANGGAYRAQVRKPSAPQVPIASIDIPREKLGLPGKTYQLYAQGHRRGDAHRPPEKLKDRYRVVLSLARTVPDIQRLGFESDVLGDSYVQFTKPAAVRAAADADEMGISYAHGRHKFAITGTANEHGRLSKLYMETPADSFQEAEDIAFGGISPFLSAMAFELDVPIRVQQMDVRQSSTGAASMTYTCPYADIMPSGSLFNNPSYVQSLLSLYREGINTNSPNYQFLCWYKVVEGINAYREPELARLKGPLPLKFTERIEATHSEHRKRLAEAFPIVKQWGASDERWDDIVPSEVLGWKFKRVIQTKLEPIRNRIAHMISEPSGDLSLSPDSRDNARELTKWVSLLRLIARVMILNEQARIPPPAPTFTVPPVHP